MSEYGPLSLTGFDEAQITAFVTDLYRIFHAREPDPIGLELYARGLRDGIPVTDTIAVFVNSDEFMERHRRVMIMELAKSGCFEKKDAVEGERLWAPVSGTFPEDYRPPGEAGRSYLQRLRSGFLDRYCSGPVVLDVGYTGYDNPERKTALPNSP